MECPACKTENPEGAKFCLNCGAKLILTCAECGKELPVNAKFCHECGVHIAEPAAPTVMDGEGGKIVEAMQRLVPQEYAERLREAGGRVTNERRLVTILFSDVKGSTAMAENLDPEEVLEIMNGAFEVLIEPVYKYEGTLARLMGDALLAFFGAPIGHEDDPERAIRAGLDIIAGAERYAKKLKEERGIEDFNVRVGINTGLVVVGEVGSDLRVEYTAMGDAINLAARMEQNAPPGGVLIAHDTYKLVRGVFDVEPQAPLTVKGVAEPVATYLVSRAKPRAFRIATRGVEGIETRMVGREAELKQMQDALYAAVEDSEGQIITVMGEAGVGKSRLLYEFTNWIDLLPQEVRFFQGRARQDAQNQPYALLRDMFSSRFLIQDGDSAGEIQQKIEAGFGEVFGQDESGQMRAHFIAQLLGFDFSGSPYLEGVLEDAQQLWDRSLIYLDEYFQGMSEAEPTVIFLEDIHWADDSSLDVINQLARKTPHRRILIVCLARPVIFERRPHWGEGLDYHHRLGIKPLTKRDSRRLVDEILQRVEQLPVELRDLVVKGAEGNPFYIEELIKMLLEDGVIVKDEEHWRVDMHRLAEVDVPTTLTGVLQARLDGLPQGERALLQQASVVGRIFWDRVLQYMIEQEAGSIPGERIEENLISLRGRELIFHRESSTFAGADEYIFKHALLRDVTYESVLKRLRRVFHSLVAEWLIDQGDEYPGLIADHLEQAREVEDAVKYLREAGDQAAGRYANAEAVQFYTRAIQLAERVSPDVVSLAGLHRGRGLAHGTVGEFDQARADFDAALHFAHTAGEYQEEWRVLLDLGKLWASRDYNKTRDYFERALELARRKDDQAVLADSLNWIGNWYANDENPIRAVECHQEALRIFKGLGNLRDLANTLDLLGIDHLLSGDLTASAEFYDQAIALFRELNDRSRLISSLMGRATIVSLLVLLASVPPTLPLDAQRGFEEAIRIAQEIDSAPDVAWAHWSRGLLYTVQGQFGPAMEVIQGGLHIASEIGHREWEVGNRFALGVLYGELFAPEFARQQLEKALNLAQELQSRYWVHHVTGALAVAYYLLDDQSLAQTCLEKVLSPQTPMDTMGKRYCWARRAELALAQGDPALALEITDRLITSAPGILKGQVITFLWMLKGNALAAIGLSDEACSLLHAARENAQATGERFLLCRIQARLERLSCFTENGREAEEELPTARMLIEELATTIPDEALKKNFLQGALKTLRPLQ